MVKIKEIDDQRLRNAAGNVLQVLAGLFDVLADRLYGPTVVRREDDSDADSESSDKYPPGYCRKGKKHPKKHKSRD